MKNRGNTNVQVVIIDEINMRPANSRFSRAFTEFPNQVSQHPSHEEGEALMRALTENPIVRNPPSTTDDTFDFAAAYDRTKADRREKLQRDRDRDRRRNRWDD